MGMIFYRRKEKAFFTDWIVYKNDSIFQEISKKNFLGFV